MFASKIFSETQKTIFKIIFKSKKFINERQRFIY